MSSSYTTTETITFTATHARHLASKIATDLKRIQRFYGQPSDAAIADYEKEATELLKAGYLGTVAYGYKRNDQWIAPTLKYTAKDLGGFSATDDDPGLIRPNMNIEGASFYSYLTYTDAWDKLSSSEQTAFKASLPFQRGGAPEPSVNGTLNHDKTYSSGGRALNRSTVKS